MIDPLVHEFGEFQLIERLAETLPPEVRTGSSLQAGIGDDAALWTPSPDESLLVTTDSLVEGVHFRTDWTSWHDLGWKMLAVNLSDIAAMAGKPRLATVSLALTGRERVADLVDLYQGAGDIASRYGVLIAGGDVVRGRETSLHVTLLGETRNGKALLRNGAREGDLVAVSGVLGASAAGLALLQLPPRDHRRQAATSDALIRAHLRPEPRIDLGGILLEQGATAAMDLSDGLLGDLPKILQASRVSATIEADRIPVPAAVRALFPGQALSMAVAGGEDYELLFTAPAATTAEISEAAAQTGSMVTVIGQVTPMDGDSRWHLIGSDGEELAIEGGFDHFATH